MRPLPRPSSAVRALLLPALTATAVGGAVAAGVVATAGPAAARVAEPPATAYQMPFPCGQAWTGTTRSSHSPNRWAVDWNRLDDLGDPVVASAPGTVSTAYPSPSGGYGRWVVVDHPATGESTLYAHLDSVAVTVGQTVDQGQQLGTLGSSGNSTGPHLHYEQRRDRTPVPAFFGGVEFDYAGEEVSRNCVDVPLAGNVREDRAAELVVFRRAARAAFLVQRPGAKPVRIRLGGAADEPVLGDWDGDGYVNPGVRTGGTATFQLSTPAGVSSVAFGLPTDRPVAGDWDGDGTWTVGVHRGSRGQFRLLRSDGTTTVVALGDTDDLPVTGDWDGDGRTDVGVFDPSTARFLLRYTDAEGTTWTGDVVFGDPGDLPVTGDWDGNGRTDVGVWDPATALFEQRRAAAPTAARARVADVRFGRPRR